MKKSSLYGLWALALLAATVLACSVFTGRQNNQPTQTPIPPTPTAEVKQLVETPLPATSTPDQMRTIITPIPGEINIRLTDAQMTEYLAEQLNNQADPILVNRRFTPTISSLT